jgi:hypothetical protein
MQLAAIDSKVYLFGGSEDKNYNYITDTVKCWDLTTNSVKDRKNMPFRQIDFSTCVYRNRYVICVGGCADFFRSEYKPRNALYDTKLDHWVTLPIINEAGVYTEHYQRLSCTTVNSKLYAFWLKECPKYTFAVMELKSLPHKW